MAPFCYLDSRSPVYMLQKSFWGPINNVKSYYFGERKTEIIFREFFLRGQKSQYLWKLFFCVSSPGTFPKILSLETRQDFEPWLGLASVCWFFFLLHLCQFSFGIWAWLITDQGVATWPRILGTRSTQDLVALPGQHGGRLSAGWHPWQFLNLRGHAAQHARFMLY